MASINLLVLLNLEYHLQTLQLIFQKSACFENFKNKSGVCVYQSCTAAKVESVSVQRKLKRSRPFCELRHNVITTIFDAIILIKAGNCTSVHLHKYLNFLGAIRFFRVLFLFLDAEVVKWVWNLVQK